jgi:hypothetical protein
MIERLRQLAHQPAQRRVMLISSVVYWLLYLLAVQDVAVHARYQHWQIQVAGNAWQLVWKSRAPFQFEPIALIQGPFFTWTASPLNALIAAGLAILVALNLALAWTAVFQPTHCRARPSTGVLAALPGLLAASACCGPVLFIVLGLPITASVVGLFSVLVPVSALLLAAALAVNLRHLRT